MSKSNSMKNLYKVHSTKLSKCKGTIRIHHTQDSFDVGNGMEIRVLSELQTYMLQRLIPDTKVTWTPGIGWELPDSMGTKEINELFTPISERYTQLEAVEYSIRKQAHKLGLSVEETVAKLDALNELVEFLKS